MALGGCGNIRPNKSGNGGTMAYLRTAALATTALGLVAGFGLPITTAYAAVVCAGGNANLACSSGDGDESDLFTIKDGTGVTSFDSSIGANNSVADVTTVTNVPVDTSNGFGEVDPSKGSGPWTTTTFTPTATSLLRWDGMIVRGQIEDTAGATYNGDLTATVTLSGGGTATFNWTGIKTNADFGDLGFDEPAGAPAFAILSAQFSLAGTGGDFKSMKQFEVSECVAASGCIGGGGQPPAIPELSTWAMLMLGLGGLGFAAFRRGKAHPAFMA